MWLSMRIRFWFLTSLAITMPGGSIGLEVDYRHVGISAEGAGFSGIVQCRSDLELAFPVAGIVADTPIQEGVKVGVGDLLMTLQQEVEAIDLQRREEIWRDRADLNATEARLKQAQEQLAAGQRIYQSSRGISAEDLSERQLQHDLLLAERARILSQERIEELDVKAAHETLARRSLRAPVHGIVSLIDRDVGEAVQPSEMVVRLCDISQLFLATNIPSGRAARLKNGDILNLRGVDPVHEAQVVVSGEVTFVSPVIDPASGLQRIRLRLKDPPDWLTPGASLPFDLDVADGSEF